MAALSSGSALLKHRLEIADQVIDKNRELLKRWNERITVSNPQFVSRFLRGEINILLKVSDSLERGIIFIQKSSEALSKDEPMGTDAEQISVSVENVPSVNLPERIGTVLVWFEGIDCLDRFAPHTLYLSHLSGFVFLERMKDRELNLVNGFSPALPVQHSHGDKMISEVIQRRAEIVYRVSRDSRNLSFVEMDVTGLEFGFRAGIRIEHERLHVKIPASRESAGGFKIEDVLIGPFNFYPDQRKSVFSVHPYTPISRMREV